MSGQFHHAVETKYRSHLCEYHEERYKKINYNGAIGVSFERNGFAVLIFKEIWANANASASQAVPPNGCNGFSKPTYAFSKPKIRKFLLIYVPTKLKTSFTREDEIFFGKIDIIVQFLVGPSKRSENKAIEAIELCKASVSRPYRKIRHKLKCSILENNDELIGPHAYSQPQNRYFRVYTLYEHDHRFLK